MLVQRHWGQVPSELFEKHRGLDTSHAQAARRLGGGDPNPPLVHHQGPQGGVKPAVVGCRPDVAAGAPVVKEPRRCIT